jgi:D-tyrosyl-tRNA(Tyr) deacylase
LVIGGCIQIGGMRVVVQRVTKASVSIDGKKFSSIGNGMLVLAGFENSDTTEDLEWISAKITNLRIFSDFQDVMNLSVKEVEGEILVVSQFTLHASTKKGNRPSYIRAASPEIAVPLYHLFIEKVAEKLGKEIQTGIFGAMMKIELLNDGPVTIIIDSKNKEL